MFRSNSSILGQRKKNQRKLRNKKRAHDRRMSESENSETEEREKYKVESKFMPQEDQSDAVKPILNPRKQSEVQKTYNIDIDNLRNNSTNPSHKRKYNKVKRNEDLLKNDKETESGDEVHAEFKSDLIFDLDI